MSHFPPPPPPASDNNPYASAPAHAHYDEPSSPLMSDTHDSFYDTTPASQQPHFQTQSLQSPPPQSSFALQPYPQQQQQPMFQVAPGPALSPAEMTLEARLRAVEERERAVAAKEKYLRDHEDHLTRKPNWPICVPIVYHNPTLDIPDEKNRRYVYWAYWFWLLAAALLVWNFMAMIAWWAAGQTNGAVAFGLALCYLAMGLPISHWLWYRQVYHAFRLDARRRFQIFYIVSACFGLFALVMLIGVPMSGAAGVYMMAQGFSGNNKSVWVFGAGGFAGWGVFLVGGCVYIYRLYKFKGFGKRTLQDRIIEQSVMRAV